MSRDQGTNLTNIATFMTPQSKAYAYCSKRVKALSVTAMTSTTTTMQMAGSTLGTLADGS